MANDMIISIIGTMAQVIVSYVFKQFVMAAVYKGKQN